MSTKIIATLVLLTIVATAAIFIDFSSEQSDDNDISNRGNSSQVMDTRSQIDQVHTETSSAADQIDQIQSDLLKAPQAPDDQIGASSERELNAEPQGSSSRAAEAPQVVAERERMIEQFNQLGNSEADTPNSIEPAKREENFLNAVSESLAQAELDNLSEQSEPDYNYDVQEDSQTYQERQESIQQFSQAQSPNTYPSQANTSSPEQREGDFLNSASDLLKQNQGQDQDY